jgi:putative phage-type endonuclease
MLIGFKDKAEWLEARRRYITGTDMAAILGLSRFGGPTSVVLDKRGLSDPKEQNEAMEWGRRLEEAILTGYAHRSGRGLLLADPNSIAVCDEHPLLAASLDATEAVEGFPVDAKNVHHFDATRWGDEGSDVIPPEYAVQLTVQMICTGAQVADLVALFSGQKLVTYRIHRDADMVASIIEAAESFHHRHIVLGVEPAPDGSEAYSTHLARKLKQQTEILLPATDDAITWAEVLRLAREERKACETEEERASQALKEIIGGALGVAGPGFKITWRESAPTQIVEWESIARALHSSLTAHFPEAEPFDSIVERFTKERPGSRRFLPKFTPHKES